MYDFKIFALVNKIQSLIVFIHFLEGIYDFGSKKNFKWLISKNLNVSISIHKRSKIQKKVFYRDKKYTNSILRERF